MTDADRIILEMTAVERAMYVKLGGVIPGGCPLPSVWWRKPGGAEDIPAMQKAEQQRKRFAATAVEQFPELFVASVAQNNLGRQREKIIVISPLRRI
jgi:hypothetical protein